MKGNRRIYLIGTALILLSVLIGLSALLIPRAVRKSDMKELLDKANKATLMAVMDPAYETGDLLGNRGKEVLLDDEERAELQRQLAAIRENGFRYKRLLTSFGSADLRVRMRIGEEETVYLWFTEQEFYYLKGESAVRFSAKDEAAHAALYAWLQGQITSE